MGNILVYEGMESQYETTVEKGVKYEFQVRAVNRMGVSALSTPMVIFIPLPVVIKEVVGKTNRDKLDHG